MASHDAVLRHQNFGLRPKNWRRGLWRTAGSPDRSGAAVSRGSMLERSAGLGRGVAGCCLKFRASIATASPRSMG